MTTANTTSQERRSLIRWLLGSGFVISLASFVYPVIRFLYPPHIAEASVNEVAAGKVQDLKPNSGKIVKFGGRPALLVRVNQQRLAGVLGRLHALELHVQYQPESSRQIWCACHNGLYNLKGKVMSGPPPRPSQEYAVRVRGDEVVISRRA